MQPRPENMSTQRCVTVALAGCLTQRGTADRSTYGRFSGIPLLCIGDVKLWAGRNSCRHVPGAGGTRFARKTQAFHLWETGREASPCITRQSLVWPTPSLTRVIRHLTFLWNYKGWWVKKKEDPAATKVRNAVIQPMMRHKPQTRGTTNRPRRQSRDKRCSSICDFSALPLIFPSLHSSAAGRSLVSTPSCQQSPAGRGQ